MHLDVEIQKYCFSERKFSFLQRPPHAPSHVMSCHEFLTYLMLYLSYIKKIILISHFFAAIGHIERNKQKSSIFDISATFLSLHWALRRSNWLKMGWGCIYTRTNMSNSPKKIIFLFQ